MFRQLVLMKQMLQKPLRYKAVALRTRSACLGLRFAGWQLFAVADGDTPSNILRIQLQASRCLRLKFLAHVFFKLHLRPRSI